MYIKLGGITVHIGAVFAVIFAIGANLADARLYLISFFCALFHESLHLFALYLCGIKKAMLDFCPGGVKLICEGFAGLSYNRVIFCTLAAPVGNIASGAVFFFLHKLCLYELFFEISAVNFILGVINLLPLPFYDGGRALLSFFGKFTDEPLLRRISSAVCIVALTVLFVILFIAFFFGTYSLFLLFFFIYSVIGCICDKSDNVFT